MDVSPHSKVASWLPRLSHWVPGEDGGELVAMIETTGDEDDIVNRMFFLADPMMPTDVSFTKGFFSLKI